MTSSPRRRPLLRVLPLILGLGVASLLQHFYGAQAVELLLMLPSEMDDGSGLTVRVTRVEDRKLVVQVQEPRRSGESHTVVVNTKLPRGKYRAEAWLENANRPAFEAEFDYHGEDLYEILLQPRASR